jgi:hypothetical protein
MLAAVVGQGDCVNILKRSGTELSIESYNSHNVLCSVLSSGYPNILPLLLDDSNSLEQRDREGVPHFLRALSERLLATHALILNHNTCLSACSTWVGRILYQVIVNGSSAYSPTLLKRISRRLIHTGACNVLDTQTRVAGTPLYVASAKGNMNSVKTLLQFGASIELEGDIFGTP